MTRVVLTGVSTRAAAASAARAGFAVTALDGYADLDQHPAVRALSLSGGSALPFSAAAAACASRSIDCDAVAYLSNFENEPAAVEELARGRMLWGNTPAVLRRVRDPLLLSETLRRHGFATPLTRLDAPPAHVPNESKAPNALNDSNDLFLVKPLRSGGGHGVRAWDGRPLPRGCYLQQRIDGTPGSLVFVAAAGKAVPLGLTRQLSGEAVFGTSGYRYCGNILAGSGDRQFDDDDRLVDRAMTLAAALAGAFALAGVNSVDFIARDGVPYPVEVNPRWSASMELVERAYGLSLFGAHATACAREELPAFNLAAARRRASAVGKAIVFADRDLTASATESWLTQPALADVPRPGTRIPAGGPICTVFAAAADGARCYAALTAQAQRVYTMVGSW
jgi:predicted ATP-grasp superfamily ATP-dependent carboligase